MLSVKWKWGVYLRLHIALKHKSIMAFLNEYQIDIPTSKSNKIKNNFKGTLKLLSKNGYTHTLLLFQRVNIWHNLSQEFKILIIEREGNLEWRIEAEDFCGNGKWLALGNRGLWAGVSYDWIYICYLEKKRSYNRR